MRNLARSSGIVSLRQLAWLAIVASLLGLHGTKVQAGAAITEFEVDGQHISLEPADAAPESTMKPVRLASTARSMHFRFSSDTNAHHPATILRYKLEGYDHAWRDLPTRMRVMVHFYSINRGAMLGSYEAPLQGETPGWRGSVKDSDYTEGKLQMLVPADARDMRLFITTGAESDVGVVGIDAVRVTVEHPGVAPRTFDIGLTPGTNNPTTADYNEYWVREGTGMEIAQVKSRLRPVRRGVLVLRDDDPERFATWATRPKALTNFLGPIAPGDRVIVEWETAHCVGNSGPGTADYEQIPPGNYQFRVAAFLVDEKTTGLPLADKVSLPIVIVPPFYRHWSFWLIVGGGIAVGSAWTARYLTHRGARTRIERLEREQVLDRERARIARDLHDEVGSRLTEITMHTDLICRDLDQGITAETKRRINRVGKSAEQLVQAVDEIVWAVNPANDTLDRFVNYLTQYADQFLDAAGVHLRYDISPNLPPATLSGALRHSLFLGVAESLHNVAKHAEANLLRIEIKLADGCLRIVVEDNGRGFDVVTVTADGTREGLGNMQRCLDRWGGRFVLTSQVGCGTRAEFHVPVSGPAVVAAPTGED